MTNEEKAHQIAWEYTKHYDPNCCKQEWVEIGAREMAIWKDKQINEILKLVKTMIFECHKYKIKEILDKDINWKEL